MKTEKPRTIKGDIAEAYQAACDGNEPVFVPVSLFADDRGWSVMNQFIGVMSPQGQVNYSVMYPSVIKAWHRHQLQSDFWLCIAGHLKIGVHREDDNTTWLIITGEKKPGVVIIPPRLWHGGATVGNQDAGLLYYVTHTFNPDKPDEERRSYDSIQGFPWGVRHG